MTQDYAWKENTPKLQQWLFLHCEIWGDFYSYPPIFSVFKVYYTQQLLFSKAEKPIVF